MVILTTMFLCKPTVGKFTITFAHYYTSNWQLGLLESSVEELILHEKYAGQSRSIWFVRLLVLICLV